MKKGMMKRIVALGAVTLLVASVSTACKPGTPSSSSAKGSGTSSTSSTLAPVTLTWYYMNTAQPKQQAVFDAMNKVLQEKINTTVNFQCIDWGAYDQKMQMIIASSQNYDVCYSGNWTNDYVTNVSKGAFQAINDLIPKYAPNYLAAAPEALQKAGYVNGKTYGIPPLQVLGRGFDFMASGPLMKKYGFDPTTVKKLEDLTPFLQDVAKSEKGIYPVACSSTGLDASDIWGYYGLELFADTNPIGDYLSADTLKAVNLYATPEFKKYCDLMHQWYQAGFFRKDAATFNDIQTDLKAKKYAVYFMTVNPDTPSNAALYFSPTNDPADVVTGFLTPKIANNSGLQASFNAISVTSQHPDRAVMMLDQFYDPKDTRLINLMEYGIEGVNYTKSNTSSDLINTIANSGYFVNCGWEHGNLFNCFRTFAAQPSWSEGVKMNSTAIVSHTVGFTFDPTSVKNQLAQCASVINEYRPGLVTGTTDPAVYLPKFLSALKVAGADKIQAELQKQFDAFKPAN